jgi:hypothetical protein
MHAQSVNTPLLLPQPAAPLRWLLACVSGVQGVPARGSGPPGRLTPGGARPSLSLT